MSDTADTPQTARLLDCDWCYEEQGEEVHPHPECAIGAVVSVGAAAPAPPVAPVSASQGSEVPTEPETATEGAAGRVGDSPPAEDFAGTQPCGHDDYHDPHPWRDRPNVWCPGHSYDDQDVAEETTR